MRKKFHSVIWLIAAFAFIVVAADKAENSTEITTTEAAAAATTIEPETTTKVNDDENKISTDLPQTTTEPVTQTKIAVGVRSGIAGAGPSTIESTLGAPNGVYGIQTSLGNGQAGASSFAGSSNRPNAFGGFNGGWGGFGYPGFPGYWGPEHFGGSFGPGGQTAGSVGIPAGYPNQGGFNSFWGPRLPSGEAINPTKPETKNVDGANKPKTPIGVHVRISAESPEGDFGFGAKTQSAHVGFGEPNTFGDFPVFAGPHGFGGFIGPNGFNTFVYPPQLAGRFGGDFNGPADTIEPKAENPANEVNVDKPSPTDAKAGVAPKDPSKNPNAIPAGFGGPGSFRTFSGAGSFAEPHGYGFFAGPNGFNSFGYPPQLAARFGGDFNGPIDAIKPKAENAAENTVSEVNVDKPRPTDAKAGVAPKDPSMNPNAIPVGFGGPGSFGTFSGAGSFAGPHGFGGFVGPNGFNSFGYPPQLAGRFGGNLDGAGNEADSVTANGIQISATSTNGTDSASVGSASFSGPNGNGGFTAFGGPNGFTGRFFYPSNPQGPYGQNGEFGYGSSFGSYGR